MKTALAIIGAVIIIGAGGIFIAHHHKSPATAANTQASTSNTQSAETMNMPSTSSPSAASSNPTATNSVVISNFAFSPANITVKAGSTVTWTNQDSTTHTVTEMDGQNGPNSGGLATGKSYSFTFTTAGTFKYHCSIHPDMLGTVTVTE